MFTLKRTKDKTEKYHLVNKKRINIRSCNTSLLTLQIGKPPKFK
jgi:hypothetical protein